MLSLLEHVCIPGVLRLRTFRFVVSWVLAPPQCVSTLVCVR